MSVFWLIIWLILTIYEPSVVTCALHTVILNLFWCNWTDLSYWVLILSVAVYHPNHFIIFSLLSLPPWVRNRCEICLHLLCPFKIETIINLIKFAWLQPSINWWLVTCGHHEYHIKYCRQSTSFFAHIGLLPLGPQHFYYWVCVLWRTCLLQLTHGLHDCKLSCFFSEYWLWSGYIMYHWHIVPINIKLTCNGNTHHSKLIL